MQLLRSLAKGSRAYPISNLSSILGGSVSRRPSTIDLQISSCKLNLGAGRSLSRIDFSSPISHSNHSLHTCSISRKDNQNGSHPSPPSSSSSSASNSQSKSKSKPHFNPEPVTSTLDLSHSEFIANAGDKPKSDGSSKGVEWKGESGGIDGQGADQEEVEERVRRASRGGRASGIGKTDKQGFTELEPLVGRLSPTSSHLFKLIIPLPKSIQAYLSNRRTSSSSSSDTVESISGNSNKSETIQTAYLLHPSQPLSHVSRLIQGSLPPSERNVEIEFRALSARGHHAYPDQDHKTKPTQPTIDHDAEGVETVQEEEEEGGPLLHERVPGGGEHQEVRWSTSTDLGDFIKQSTLSQSFRIVIRDEEGGSVATTATKASTATNAGGNQIGEGGRQGELELEKGNINQNEQEREQKKESTEMVQPDELSIEVMIPSFESRTVYLRKRLLKLSKDLQVITDAKKKLDDEAQKGARRFATSGLAGLVIYWGVVFKLTFFSPLGWDVMEPVTYLSGLATVISGYLFFLYHNREVSYSSILDMSVSARQQRLYAKKGLDVEGWSEMVAEAREVRRQIKRIAQDYEYDWKGEVEMLEKRVEMDKDRRGGAKEQKGEQTKNKVGDVDDDSSRSKMQDKGIKHPNSNCESESDSKSEVGNGKPTQKNFNKDKAEAEADSSEKNSKKIDIDATIDEASELEEQTRRKELDRKHGKGGKGGSASLEVGKEKGKRKAKEVAEEG